MFIIKYQKLTYKLLNVFFIKFQDYPDYYDIIKNPMDMDRISQKLKMYDSVDELSADIMLMFENACKYNEPDSQIYKDALVLQQICIQTKKQLNETNSLQEIPDIAQAVQEMLIALFTSFYNHEDTEGRCYSDSLADLPEYDVINGNNVRGISLDLVKRRLDKGLYKRMDVFQQDIFACLDRARQLSRTDSQIFEDSIELQSFFIQKRDELCKKGQTLSTPALSFTAAELNAQVDALKQTKLLQEEQDLDNDEIAATQGGQSVTIDQKVYSPGDFVYYVIPDNKIPGIVYIEKLYTNSENVQMCYGTTFIRPFETYHVATRRFLEKEIFRSARDSIEMTRVRGKCFVMSVKDYFKLRPESFDDRDIYVCESRYTSRLRSFKKFKTWPFTSDENAVKLVPRDEPLEPLRIMSVFKERVEKHKGELAELQEQEALVEKEKPNLKIDVSDAQEGCTYYEQYNTISNGAVRTGDFVYVANNDDKQSLMQIHALWVDSK